MIRNQLINAGRRRFMGLVSSISAGLLISDGKRVSAAKNDCKQIIEAIEAEKLIESYPKRHPGIYWQQVGDSTILHKKGKEDPFCRLNRAGTIIWNSCNGTYSPWDLAHIVHRTFQIETHQAYVDCLCFLALLNAKGAIQL